VFFVALRAILEAILKNKKKKIFEDKVTQNTGQNSVL
jgi:hypothetical protein